MGHVNCPNEAAAAARNYISSGLMEPIEAFCNRGLRSVSASVYCLFCVRMSRKDIP